MGRKPSLKQSIEELLARYLMQKAGCGQGLTSRRLSILICQLHDHLCLPRRKCIKRPRECSAKRRRRIRRDFGATRRLAEFVPQVRLTAANETDLVHWTSQMASKATELGVKFLNGPFKRGCYDNVWNLDEMGTTSDMKKFSQNNPAFVFLDSHFSHTEPDMLLDLASRGVYIMFILPNTSDKIQMM
eukprot:815008_1